MRRVLTKLLSSWRFLMAGDHTPALAKDVSESRRVALCSGRSENFTRFYFDELRNLATVAVECIRRRIARSRQVDRHDCLDQAGPRRHHGHAIGEVDSLVHAVRYENHCLKCL